MSLECYHAMCQTESFNRGSQLGVPASNVGPCNRSKNLQTTTSGLSSKQSLLKHRYTFREREQECFWKVKPARLYRLRGFPGGTSGKEPSCQCRRHKRCRFHPCVRMIPWRRAWQPTSVFLPGEYHGQRSLVGCSS